MSGERICIVGPEHRVAIIGAILARRWSGEGRELLLAPSFHASGGETIIARPDHVRVHAELGLTPDMLVQNAGAVPVLATKVDTAAGNLALPFSPFGMARSGVEFHHFWQRASTSKRQPDLAEFSLALALDDAADSLSLTALSQLPLQYGYRLDRAKYASLLMKGAVSLGAKAVTEPSTADITIDCGSSGTIPGWSGGTLFVATDNDIPGLDWQLCVNAARRLLGLLPRLDNCESERREYTRLASEEADRIADMRTLLMAPEPGDAASPALQRKIDVFTACGRIPTEDFEVFGQPEWLAALWGRGLRPRRFDRMVKAMPEDDLHRWLSSLRKQIVEITDQISRQRQVA